MLQLKGTKYLFAAIAILTLAGTACTDTILTPFIRGNGNLTFENRAIKEISSVEVNIPADVIIRKSNKPGVLIEADQNLMPFLATDVIGETLCLQSRRNILTGRNRITVYIDMPYIHKLTTRGSGNIFVEDIFQADYVSLLIAGSGNISVITETGNLHSRIIGSGNIEVEGSAGKHTIDIMGSGKVRAYYLENENCTINVTGSGNSYVQVNSSLDAHIAGSGNVYVKGSPQVNVRVNGSGKVINVDL